MNNGDKIRLQHLESQMKSMDKKIDLILENHLPHIQADLATLKTKIIIAFTIGGFIIGMLVEFIMRKL